MNLRNRHKNKKKQTTTTTGGVRRNFQEPQKRKREKKEKRDGFQQAPLLRGTVSKLFDRKKRRESQRNSTPWSTFPGIVLNTLAPKFAERSLSFFLANWAVVEEKRASISGVFCLVSHFFQFFLRAVTEKTHTNETNGSWKNNLKTNGFITTGRRSLALPANREPPLLLNSSGVG